MKEEILKIIDDLIIDVDSDKDDRDYESINKAQAQEEILEKLKIKISQMQLPEMAQRTNKRAWEMKPEDKFFLFSMLFTLIGLLYFITHYWNETKNRNSIWVYNPGSFNNILHLRLDEDFNKP